MPYETEASVAGATVDKPQPSTRRYRCVFRYRIDGDLRYLSHHDTVRLFQRALARAELPVKHSEGFNPHARIQFPLPRAVGLSSEAEYVLVEFAEPVDPADARDRLARSLPRGLALLEARETEVGETLLPAFVRYRLLLKDEDRAALRDRLATLVGAQTLDVTRVDAKKKTRKTIDVRPYLADVRLAGDAVEWTLRVTPTGTARPAEIAALLGFGAGPINHRIRRMEIQWH